MIFFFIFLNVYVLRLNVYFVIYKNEIYILSMMVLLQYKLDRTIPRTVHRRRGELRAAERPCKGWSYVEHLGHVGHTGHVPVREVRNDR